LTYEQVKDMVGFLDRESDLIFIEKAEQVEDSKHDNKADIHLSQNFKLIDSTEIRMCLLLCPRSS
jgi:hypothetical protein